MTKRAGAALFLAFALLWLVANRGAYKSYFQDDEIDNLSWTRWVDVADFAWGVVTPRIFPNNFRPIGHFLFRSLSRSVELDFPKYVAVIHALHLLNVWLVWLLARRMGASVPSACAGTAIFAFHMALFDAYWKPMYVFDILCALFSLLCLLLYSHGRMVLSFAAFWLAYKSKELAVMLPFVLACYELWLGGKRWRRLTPFFLVSLLFGCQAILRNTGVETGYSLRFTPAAVWQCVSFYSSQVLLIPFAGLALFALPWLVKDKRVWFGLAAMTLFLIPLLALPGRLYAAYCYLPLAALALAVSAIPADRRVLAAALLAWVAANFYLLRGKRRQALYLADLNRSYIAGVLDFARSAPDLRTFVYDGSPENFHHWGIAAALQYEYRTNQFRLVSVEDAGAPGILAGDSLGLLIWDNAQRKLLTLARLPGSQDAAYLTMNPQTPLWQLGAGWYRLESRMRWIHPQATARLHRPAGAREFEITVNCGPDFMREMGRVKLHVSIGGQPAGSHEFTTAGWHTVRLALTPAPVGSTQIEFRTDSEYHPSNGDPRTLGIPIGAFGFRP